MQFSIVVVAVVVAVVVVCCKFISPLNCTFIVWDLDEWDREKKGLRRRQRRRRRRRRKWENDEADGKFVYVCVCARLCICMCFCVCASVCASGTDWLESSMWNASASARVVLVRHKSLPILLLTYAYSSHPMARILSVQFVPPKRTHTHTTTTTTTTPKLCVRCNANCIAANSRRPSERVLRSAALTHNNNNNNSLRASERASPIVHKLTGTLTWTHSHNACIRRRSNGCVGV